MRTFLVALISCLVPWSASGQRVGPVEMPPQAEARAAAEPALRVAERVPLPQVTLLPAEHGAAGLLRSLEQWNAEGRLPARDGLVRALPAPLQVELPVELDRGRWQEGPAGAAHRNLEGDLVWGTSLQVLGAHGLRARLDGVRLPRDAELWVWGIGEAPRRFGSELQGPEGELWTPSVGGEILYLETRIPARGLAPGAGYGFTVGEVLELLAPAAPAVSQGLSPKAHDGCIVDARCVDASTLGVIDAYRRAVAQLRFVSGSFSAACSGALINDTDPSTFVPYLLTANHCISTDQAAASLEAFWDFHPENCGDPAPTTGSLPRSSGSTLLATGSATDFTLLRLHSVPPSRVLLGWDARPQALSHGTVLHRLSHPVPHGGIQAQRYSQSTVDTQFPGCGGRSRPRFFYAENTMGGTYGGSSGAPVVLAGGFVVGQLSGGCGDTPDPGDGCDYRNQDFDGAFSETFRSVASWLDPVGAMSLHGGRFQLSVDWHNQFNDERGSGVPIPATDLGGYFYFTDPNNIELMVKMLDFGEHVLLFYGQLTNLKFRLTVTDTSSGATKIYENGPNDCGAIDSEAFPGSGGSSAGHRLETAPGPADWGRPGPGLPAHGRAFFGSGGSIEHAVSGRQAGSCVPGPQRLCLLGSRIAVDLDWRNQFNGHSGPGMAEPMSDLTGSFAFDDPANLEVLVKALDFGGQILIIWGALSNLEYTLRVTDTFTGAVNTYHNPAGTYCGGLDDDAF